MIRLTDSILVVAAIAGAVWTYQIKHEAELSARELTDLRSKIASQENKITLLEADWAIMTSPGRLEKVAENFAGELELKPLSSSQIIGVEELPALRPEPIVETIQVESEEVDELVTGSIPKMEKPVQKLPEKIAVPTFRTRGAGQ